MWEKLLQKNVVYITNLHCHYKCYNCPTSVFSVYFQILFCIDCVHEGTFSEQSTGNHGNKNQLRFVNKKIETTRTNWFVYRCKAV